MLPNTKNDDRWQKAVTLERVILATLVIVAGLLYHKLRHTEQKFTELQDNVQALTEINANPARMALPDGQTAPLPPGFDALLNPRGHAPLQHNPAHSMQQQFNRLFQEAMMDFDAMENFMNLDRDWASAMSAPAMDLRSEPDQYVVLMSTPGLDMTNIQVTLEGRLLTVLHPRQETRGAMIIPAFKRQILLPGPVQADATAKADLKNNVLRVVIPKNEHMEGDPHLTHVQKP
jgi:HSP20 family molecular chaperone IbpA